MLKLKCVIFDLDNTLVDSKLDFGAIKAEIGTALPILEYRATVPAEEQARVDAILDRHESRAAAECAYLPGAPELVAFLDAHRVRTALLTRNSRKTVEALTERLGMRFDITLSREDSEPKPSPEPVLHICRELGVPPERCLMVGDYLYDMQSGERAGAMTLLVDSPNRHRFDFDADYEAADLHDAMDIIKGLLNHEA